jgi:hypothetical protein
MSTKFSISSKALRWIRIIHRDLGFLMVGVSLIYAISGILLNHLKDGDDPAYKIWRRQHVFERGLSKEQLSVAWEAQPDLPTLKRIFDNDEESGYRLMLSGGMGIYDPQSGAVEYEVSRKRALIYWINRLHYNKVNGWSPMADFFAGALIFFALSGLIMVKGKHGIAGRGKWYVLLGLAIPIVYVLLAL